MIISFTLYDIINYFTNLEQWIWVFYLMGCLYSYNLLIDQYRKPGPIRKTLVSLKSLMWPIVFALQIVYYMVQFAWL